MYLLEWKKKDVIATHTAEKIPFHVRRIVLGRHHAILLAIDGSVWGRGQCSSGQLGKEWIHQTRVENWTKLNIPMGQVQDCLVTDFETLVIIDGLAFRMGLNPFDQLMDFDEPKEGTLSNREKMLVSKLKDTLGMNIILTSPDGYPLQNCIQCVGGQSHFLFLNRKGSVYGVGSNSMGALGLGSNVSICPHAHQIPKIPPIKQIASTHEHSAFLTFDGLVYLCGSNTFGQCAFGNTKNHSTPKKSKFIHSVKQVACGRDFTVFLNGNGELFGCGQSDVLFVDGPVASKPVPVLDQTTFTRVKVGPTSILGTTTDGHLLSWGRNILGTKEDGTYRAKELHISRGKLSLDHFSLCDNGSLVAVEGNEWEDTNVYASQLERSFSQSKYIQSPITKKANQGKRELNLFQQNLFSPKKDDLNLSRISNVSDISPVISPEDATDVLMNQFLQNISQFKDFCSEKILKQSRFLTNLAQKHEKVRWKLRQIKISEEENFQTLKEILLPMALLPPSASPMNLTEGISLLKQFGDVRQESDRSQKGRIQELLDENHSFTKQAMYIKSLLSEEKTNFVNLNQKLENYKRTTQDIQIGMDRLADENRELKQERQGMQELIQQFEERHQKIIETKERLENELKIEQFNLQKRELHLEDKEDHVKGAIQTLNHVYLMMCDKLGKSPTYSANQITAEVLKRTCGQLISNKQYELLEKEAVKLKIQLDDQQNKMQFMQSDLEKEKQWHGKYNELMQRYSELQRQYKNLSGQKEESVSLTKQLEIRLQDSETTIESLKSEEKQQKLIHEAEKKKWKDSLEKSEQKLKELETKAQNLHSKAIGDHISKQERILNDNSRLHSKIKSQGEQINHFETVIFEQKKEIDILSDSVDNFENCANILYKHIAIMENSIDDLLFKLKTNLGKPTLSYNDDFEIPMRMSRVQKMAEKCKKATHTQEKMKELKELVDEIMILTSKSMKVSYSRTSENRDDFQRSASLHRHESLLGESQRQSASFQGAFSQTQKNQTSFLENTLKSCQNLVKSMHKEL